MMLRTLVVLLLAVGCKSSASERPPSAKAPVPQLQTSSRGDAARPVTMPRAPGRAARPANWYPWLCRRGACRSRNPRRESVVERFSLPPGCRRVPYPRGSFADWVRHLPLRPPGASVLDYRGRPLTPRMQALAVLDVDVYPRGRDWQQCADYGLRLGAEYLARFRPGRRVRWWLQSGAPYRFAPTPRSVGRHLRHLFVYLGTFGLKSYFPAVRSVARLRPGDIVVGNSTGAIGHAVVVQDVLDCRRGGRRFLVSQSWIPAQSPHIPRLGDAPNGGAYVTWPQLAAFIREVTGDRAAHLRRLPGT